VKEKAMTNISSGEGGSYRDGTGGGNGAGR
jgi:hypothetical protein